MKITVINIFIDKCNVRMEIICISSLLLTFFLIDQLQCHRLKLEIDVEHSICLIRVVATFSKEINNIKENRNLNI